MEKETGKWYEEFEGKSSEWLKIEEGHHTVRFTTGEPSEPYESTYTEDNGRTITMKKVYFEVIHEGKTCQWSMRISDSDTSLYGMVANLAKKLKGLKDTDVEVIVTGKGKKKRYVLPQLYGDK